MSVSKFFYCKNAFLHTIITIFKVAQKFDINKSKYMMLLRKKEIKIPIKDRKKYSPWKYFSQVKFIYQFRCQQICQSVQFKYKIKYINNENK